jgi:hypothetical protein
MDAILRDFLVAWATGAEALMADTQARNDRSWSEPIELSPIEALRRTLRLTEVSQPQGRLPSGFIGAAMTLLAMHWVHGETLYDEMTPIEQHLTEDATLVKIQQLQREAEAAGNA